MAPCSREMRLDAFIAVKITTSNLAVLMLECQPFLEARKTCLSSTSFTSITVIHQLIRRQKSRVTVLNN